MAHQAGAVLVDDAERLWQMDNPASVAVLRALGRWHPDKEAAKALRRAPGTDPDLAEVVEEFA